MMGKSTLIGFQDKEFIVRDNKKEDRLGMELPKPKTRKLRKNGEGEEG
jgi:hypothetical protein